MDGHYDRVLGVRMRNLRNLSERKGEVQPAQIPVLGSKWRGGFSAARSAFRTPLDFVDRRWDRIHLSFDAMVTRANGMSLPVRVLNFSAGGFLISNDAGLSQAEEVRFEFGDQAQASGRIVWNRNGIAGGAFLNPIDAKALVLALETDQKIVPAE